MRENVNRDQPPADLQIKLERIKTILAEMSAQERAYLAQDQRLVEDTFGVIRRPSPSNVKSLADSYLKQERPFPPHSLSVVVEQTASQREEARKLQEQILKARVSAGEWEALSRLRGRRIDAFPDPDPEPASDQEE
jgi:hypothetical protein